jgi:flavodoxin
MNDQTRRSRRAFLRGGITLGASTWIGTTLFACSSPDSAPTTATQTTRPTPRPATTASSPTSRTLLAYFSRPGEDYYYGGRRNLEVGNTEVLARMISELIDCDVYRIEAAEPYPASYDATVERNVREQNAEARPVIANPLASIARYDTVLLGGPIWNLRPPMIMTTFTESHDFAGKQIHPFVTFAVSGLGRTEPVYAAARIGDGLAIRGEEVLQHRSDLEAWVRNTGLPTG